MDKIAAEGVTYNAATTKETTLFYFSGLFNVLLKCLETLACLIIDNNYFDIKLFELLQYYNDIKFKENLCDETIIKK